MKQTAILTLTFEDGHQQHIRIKGTIELGVTPQAKQSIEFRETSGGSWVMAFTKPIFNGRKIQSIN